MITREDILLFLKNNRDLLKTKFYVEKIGLFGSYSRNEQSPESDIDLLIRLHPHTPDIYRNKKAIKSLFKDTFHCPVDIASEKYLKPYLKAEILKETVYV